MIRLTIDNYICSFLLVFACKQEKKTEIPALDEVLPETKWKVKTGSTFLTVLAQKGWRAYNGDALPPGWIIKDSALTFDTRIGIRARLYRRKRYYLWRRGI